MKTYKVNRCDGWLAIDANTKKIVAHYKDGHTEEFATIDFVILPPRIKKQIVKIDCYEKED